MPGVTGAPRPGPFQATDVRGVPGGAPHDRLARPRMCGACAGERRKFDSIGGGRERGWRVASCSCRVYSAARTSHTKSLSTDIAHKRRRCACGRTCACGRKPKNRNKTTTRTKFAPRQGAWGTGSDLLKGRLISWLNARFFFAGTALNSKSERSSERSCQKKTPPVTVHSSLCPYVRTYVKICRIFFLV